jgi:hypothetical protein
MILRKVREYRCDGREPAHRFLGHIDRERVPNVLGRFVCSECLPQINRCRREKGLEPLHPFSDSYPDVALPEGKEANAPQQ